LTAFDVHQHLLPDLLRDALRRRSQPPFLRGMTLHLRDRAPVQLHAADYDLATRRRLVTEDGLDVALVSLSSPFGIECLPGDDAGPLLEAYHSAVHRLPPHFGAWAGACVSEPDPLALAGELARGRVGLQLPANALSTPAGWEHLGDLLSTLEEHDRPLMVHPGPVAPGQQSVPGWWLPMVSFVGQQHAAWHAWQVTGRAHHPRLRVCFVGLAGLAPLHGERMVARGGSPADLDPDVFYETSSYGPLAIGALRRCVGPGTLVQGSDRPYAMANPQLSGPEWADLRTVNTQRLLFGDTAPGST